MVFLNKRLQIERTKNIMDKIVYFSSFVDVLIAILVMLSYFKIGNPELILLPVEYILTATVVLTIILAVLLIYLKHYESILARFLHVGNHVKNHVSRFQQLIKTLSAIRPPKYRYKYKS